MLTRRQALQLTAASFLPTFVRGADELPVSGTADKRLEPFDTMMSEFIQANKVPGGSLAVARGGKVIYSRGFGYADTATKKSVQPGSLFRIASISKPITAVAIMQLAEKKKLKLDDKVLDHLKIKPFLVKDAKVDDRWKSITIRHCLQHTGGWDRDKSYDVCFRIWQIAKDMGTKTPVPPKQIVQYSMGLPLDFDPGTKYAYSNVGYLVLGEILETLTGNKYEEQIKESIFKPLKLTSPQLCRVFAKDRPKDEVTYYDSKSQMGDCLYPPKVGEKVPFPDGAMNVEAFAAHGGWIASASDLVSFASAFNYASPSPLLSAESIQTMWARPSYAKDKTTYYGCGWNVRPVGTKANAWHSGLIPGTSTILIHRWDDLAFATLFNMDRAPATTKTLSSLIDPKLHEAANAVKW